MHFTSGPDNRLGDAVLLNSSGCCSWASLICIDLKSRRDQRNWIQRPQLSVCWATIPMIPFLLLQQAQGCSYSWQLGSWVRAPHFFNLHPCEIASHQEGREEKNLFKYNSCLEGKISILCVSFVKLKSIGCLLKRCFFEAPTLVLCLTDVSINTWWSVTSQPTPEQQVSPGPL